SERNVVVHVVAAAATAAGRDAALLDTVTAPAGRAPRARTEIAAVIGQCAAASAATAIEHGQHGIEALQYDLGRVLVLAGLVLPLPRLQLALDVNLRALLQILFGNPAQALIENDDAVPLGLLLAFAGRL